MAATLQEHRQVVERPCREFGGHLPAAVVAEVVCQSEDELSGATDPARSRQLEPLARARLRFLDTPGAWLG
jgi:hypothetical protein